jgi:hypothetical protein
VSEPKREPPKSAEELLARCAAGERMFGGSYLAGEKLDGANLSGADLSGSYLRNSYLRGANLRGADLSSADLTGASLSQADLSGASLWNAQLALADLSGANFFRATLAHANLSLATMIGAVLSYANLTGADLALAELRGAEFEGARLSGANLTRAKITAADFSRAELGATVLEGIDLSPFCEAIPAVTHLYPSTIGDTAIVRSLRSPGLKDFLVRAGMLEVFAEFRISCARSLDPLGVFRMLQSTFISYGGPDEPFARNLYESLHRNGVTTFFFPEHAVPGERLHRTMRRGVNEFDRTILVCSKDSLDRKGVLNEIEEILAREARDGGASYLIPITIDDYVFAAWKPAREGIAQAVRDKVVADFQGADTDPAKFSKGLQRLIAALKK